MARTQKAVCFDCRLSFHSATQCPNCKGPMISAGYFFRAPPRQKVKAWKKLERRVVRFDGGGFLCFTNHGKGKERRREQQVIWPRERTIRRRWKSCPICNVFMKRGVLGMHIKACQKREEELKLKTWEPSSITSAIRDRLREESFKRHILPLQVLL